MDLKTIKTLGGLGGLFIVLSFIPYIGSLLGLAGIILLAIAIKKISDKYPGKDIFSNFIKGLIVGFIGGIILIFGFISTVANQHNFSVVGLLGLIIGYVSIVAASYFYKLTFSSVGEVLNQNLFKTAGNLIFWGSIAIIIVIGGLIIWVGWILITVAFFTLSERIQITETKEVESQI